MHDGDNNEETLLNSPNITLRDCANVEKDSRSQNSCSLWFELRLYCV